MKRPIRNSDLIIVAILALILSVVTISIEKNASSKINNTKLNTIFYAGVQQK